MSSKSFNPIKAVLQVSRKEYITPHYIRVYLTGDDVQKFSNTTIGVNNKILIPPKGAAKVHIPEFDNEKKQWKPLPEELRPTIRTYTHRGIDLDNQEIWIDFVAHGDEGPASAWAIHADIGDSLGVLMKDGKTKLYGDAKNYILVGDATAIPVIGAILEDLPSTAKATCILEVHGKEDEQPLHTDAKIQMIWLHNKHPQAGSALAETLKNIELPTHDRFAYIAAEFSSVKEIRQYLRKEKNWKQEELYAYSYWKTGVAEDKSATDRRDESVQHK